MKKSQSVSKTMNPSYGIIRGAQLQSRESFLYGRFETMMRPAFGSGIVSSFYLFNDELGFQNNWNEIDFEILGKNTNSIDSNVIKTIGGVTDNNLNVKHHTLAQRSSDAYWKLSISWTPTTVTWHLNDVIIRVLEIAIKKPMKIMMNIWKGKASWAGEFNSGLMPQYATYEYLRFSQYINGKFEYVFQDDFHAIDASRWWIATHKTGDTMFVKDGVSIYNSKLLLTLRE